MAEAGDASLGGNALKCPNCGMDNPDDNKFCGDCGARLEASIARKCVNCGRVLGFDAMICQYCGHDYRPKFRGGTDKAATKFLSYGLIVVGVWALAAGALNYVGFSYTIWRYLDIAIGILLLVFGIRALSSRE